MSVMAIYQQLDVPGMTSRLRRVHCVLLGHMTRVSKNIFRCSLVSAALLVISVAFFPGQALLKGGRCIRFINVPLFGWHEVPLWYQAVMVWTCLFFLLVTIITLMLGLILGWRQGQFRQQS
jgi:hypothetical protein